MAFKNPNTGYRYSYSGTDTQAFAYFPSFPSRIVPLESLHTISYSVHEAKSMARSLGYKGIKGITKAVRTVAGSLITTVIEDHPLANLMDLYADLVQEENIYTAQLPSLSGWAIDWESVGMGSGIDKLDFRRRIGPTLPPFNIILRYVAEGSRWNTNIPPDQTSYIEGAAAEIIGIELVDEGSVTSVSDSVTEFTYSFLAKDIKALSKQNFEIGSFRREPDGVELETKFKALEHQARLFGYNFSQQAQAQRQRTLYENGLIGSNGAFAPISR